MAFPGRSCILVPATVLALALAGCGTESSSSDQAAGDFTGQQLEVANTVQDFGDAAKDQDAEQICADLLAATLVRELGGPGCADKLETSLRDANAFDLVIAPRGITVSGNRATAKVVTELGDRDATDTVDLVRERGRWKIAQLGAAAR